MALLHRTSLVPSKLDLVNGWIVHQPWFEADAHSPLVQVASFRFDDPEGQVGIETLLLSSSDGSIFQVPLTYRNDPLEGADRWLIGTMEHGVLGTRWTYDALGDPIYVQELATTILSGGSGVEQWIEIDGVMTLREPTALVQGSGGDPDPDVNAYELDIVRLPGTATAGPGDFVLTGTWTDSPQPTVLAIATPR
jgi:hypothetical protein